MDVCDEVGDKYRFGFNGQEKVNEIAGIGNHLDFKFRGYDPRIGRFWSVDPLARSYPWNSTYAFAENRVIDGIDLEGKEWESIHAITIEQYFGETAAKVYRGVNDGIDESLEGTWNFITRDMWKSSTWKEMGLFLEEAALSTSSVKTFATPRVDGAVEGFKKDVINGDAYTRTKFIAGITTDALITKGANSTLKVFKSMSVLEKVAVRSRLASDFYKKVGFSTTQAAEHMRGINFEKAVQTTILKKGTIVQQWVGENGIGNYFTSLENGAAKNLGISYEGRTLQQFTLTNDVKVLKSTASEFDGKKGGGIQYFNPEIKNNITPIQTGN